MDGVVNILKPQDMTSFDVVAYIRRITGVKKVGHTGTLDPNAVGVLPICLGKATKIADNIAGTEKEYRAELKLGIKTKTADKDGEIICKKNWEDYIDKDNFKEEILKVLEKFIGEIEQIPPMYSAIKINGQKLYELARKGIEVQRKVRIVTISNISLIDFDINKGTLLINVVCSKGTYIRTLCEDIGEVIGSGAYMTYLVRTRVGDFQISDSKTLEEFVEGGCELIESNF